jgi:UDP-glucose 6-dehydrogenase
MVIDDKNLKKKILALGEPMLREIYDDFSSNIQFLSELNSLAEFDLIVIAIDTETNVNNEANYSEIESSLGRVRSLNQSRTPVVLLSQVYPGFTRQFAGDFPLFYVVETLVFGDAIQRLEKLETLIVGVPAVETNHIRLPDEFLSVFSCKPIYMDYESGELSKIAINIILGFQILSSNLLATVAELTTASWSMVERAIRSDRRIGYHSYLKPEMGFLGGNIPRDFNVLLEILSYHQSEKELVFLKEALNYNRRLVEWVSLQASRYVDLGTARVIGLLGYTYKQGTHFDRNSLASQLIEIFGHGRILIHEPDDIDIFSPARQESSFEEFVQASDLVIVCRKDSRFDEMICYALSGKTVIDPFVNFKRSDFERNVNANYITRG